MDSEAFVGANFERNVTNETSNTKSVSDLLHNGTRT